MTRRNFLRATAACSVAVSTAAKVLVITEIDYATKTVKLEWINEAQMRHLFSIKNEVLFGGSRRSCSFNMQPPIMRPPTDEEWYRDYVDPERA